MFLRHLKEYVILLHVCPELVESDSDYSYIYLLAWDESLVLFFYLYCILDEYLFFLDCRGVCYLYHQQDAKVF